MRLGPAARLKSSSVEVRRLPHDESGAQAEEGGEGDEANPVDHHRREHPILVDGVEEFLQLSSVSLRFGFSNFLNISGK